MRYLSVCSGIEAASVAWGPLGWQAVAFSEIEPFPCAVLTHHYPDVPNLGDMTTIAQRILNGEVEAPDVLAGGTPCQAFSVAGLRKSLADERGNLTLKFVEIADAIDFVRVRDGRPPAIVFWENVPGVLSTKDNAFGCFLAGLAGEDEPLQPPGGKWANAGAVYGPARAIAWRVLDAQYFGLAQRRRRVFVVASARDGFDPATVLFEWDGVRRDSPPSRESGKVAPAIPSSSTGGGGLGTDFECAGGTICVATGQAGAEICADMAPTLNCNHEAPYVAHSLRGEGFDASEDGTGRGTPLVPVGVTIHGTQTVQKVASYDELAQCLRARTPGNIDNSSTTVVQQPVTYSIRTANTSSNGWGIQEEHTHTMDCAQGVAVAQPVAHAIQAGALRVNPLSGPDGIGVQADHAYTLEARAEVQAVAVREIAQTVTSNYGKQCDNSDTALGPNVAIQSMQVRRLTPTECARLQGFPDDYLDIPYRGKPAADGPKYKALGNSWAVPVVRWIGERINAAVEQIKHERKAA